MEPSPPAPPKSAAIAEIRMRTLIGENRFVDAMEYAKPAREAFPRDSTLAALQAYVYLRMGRGEMAAAGATEALDLGSDDPVTVLVLGLAHRNRARYGLAAEIFLQAHRRYPERADFAGLLVEAMVQAHGVDATRPVFEEVFAATPDRSVALIWAKLLFGAGADDGFPAGVISAPVTSVTAWLAQAGETPTIIGERELFPLENPPIFGDPPQDRYKAIGEGYIPYLATLRDATIFHRSGLILMPDGTLLNDTVADERWGQFLDLLTYKLILGRRGQRVLFDVGNPVTELETGVMLSGWGSEHFGHWVPEFLCRLPYFQRHPRFADLPLIVDSDMPPQHLEYLRLLVSNPIVEIPPGGAFRCRELVVASPACFFPMHLTPNHAVPPENEGGLPIGGFRYLQSRVAERLPPPATHDRKLYLSRKSRTWRRPSNEDEVISALTARGFEILLPETMTIEEQVRMYQGAAVVVAPIGSSLINAVFAPKDTKLLILSQRGMFNSGTLYGPMRELGYDLTFFCSEREIDHKHADYSMDVPSLLAALDSLSG
jgi:capsular polysaccharide biosynthesis protein/tetratricopeptide (TPR) repeat protein